MSATARVAFSLVIGAGMLAPDAAAPGERLRVHVGPKLTTSGYVDAGKGETDSVKDIKKRLGKHFDVVTTLKESDFAVIVLGRGQGSTDLGYVGGFAADDQGAAGGFHRASQLDYWVAVDLIARQGFSKRIIGTHGAVNNYQTIGAWGDCASQIAKDVRAWAEANAERLIEQRGKGASEAQEQAPQ